MNGHTVISWAKLFILLVSFASYSLDDIIYILYIEWADTLLYCTNKQSVLIYL